MQYVRLFYAATIVSAKAQDKPAVQTQAVAKQPVTGTVTDAATKKPIPGASVKITVILLQLLQMTKEPLH